MFVPAVVASDLARDTILAPNVGPLQQTKQQKITTDSGAKVNQQNQQKSQKPLRQLVVVPSPADGFPDNLDGYVESGLYRNHPGGILLLLT